MSGCREVAKAVAVAACVLFSGYAFSGADFCWKESYGRGVGTIPTECGDLEKIGLLCYQPCPAGMVRKGVDCHSKCPVGWTDDGLFCRRSSYIPAGWPWKAGDPAFDYTKAKERCEKRHGKGNCVIRGAMAYKKCGPGYKRSGTGGSESGLICTPVETDCGEHGLNDFIGGSCAKKIEIGRVSTPQCSGEKSGGLCYDKCASGFEGAGPVCWGQCPDGWVQCGGGCAESAAACATSTADQALSVVDSAVAIASLVATAGGSGGATQLRRELYKTALETPKAILESNMQGRLTEAAIEGATDNAQASADSAVEEYEKAKKALDRYIAIDEASGSDYESDLEIASESLSYLADADPTGVAGVVAAYTRPVCSDIGAAAAPRDANAQSSAIGTLQGASGSITANMRASLEAQLQEYEETRDKWIEYINAQEEAARDFKPSLLAGYATSPTQSDTYKNRKAQLPTLRKTIFKHQTLLLEIDRLEAKLQAKADAEKYVKSALTLKNGNTYLFYSNGEYTRISAGRRVGFDPDYPLGIRAHWSSLPENWRTEVDAAMLYQGGDKAYMFTNGQYARLTDTKVDSGYGYPKNLPGGWSNFPVAWGRKVDAAVYLQGSKAHYLFQGNQYVRVEGTRAGQVKELPGGWQGMPAHFAKGIDAATYRNGHTFMIKGDEYIRFTGFKMDVGYPKKIAGNFPDAEFRRVTSAYTNTSGNTYLFFDDDQYGRVSKGEYGLDAGYPKEVVGSFEGIPYDWRHISDASREELPGNPFKAVMPFEDSGRSYVFHDNRVAGILIFEYARMSGAKIDSGYPKPMPGGWKNWPSHWDKVDAAMYVPQYGNGKHILFNGDEFLQMTDYTVDRGYPRPILTLFKLPRASHFASGIDAATVRGNSIYLFKDDEYVRLNTSFEIDPDYPKRIKGIWYDD